MRSKKPLAPRNCVYETSDGVCFTTKVFDAEPIKIDHGNYYSYQSWLGSKDACESQGYRLPKVKKQKQELYIPAIMKIT